MYGLNFFAGFEIRDFKVITKSPKIHYCSVCGSKLHKRKVRITGYTQDTKEFKKAFFCASSKCWGEVSELVRKRSAKP